MMNSSRKDIHLSLTGDQYDDLTSALETHRKGFQELASEASNGFGFLDTAYWTQRIIEVEQLIDAVHRLARGDNPEIVKQELDRKTAGDMHDEPGTQASPEP